MPVTVRRSEFSDFEALQSIVQHDGHPEIVQLDSGRMRGTLQHITLGSAFNVSTVSFSRGLRARGVLSKSRWMIGMLLAADGPVLTLEREMSAGDMAIVAPGQDRYISYRGSSRYLATFVAPEQLETFLATQPGAQDALAWRQPITMLTADRATAAANVRQLSILCAR